MIHLLKLAVGVRDIGHLTEIQHRRALVDAPLRHQTRSFPKRADELRDGGSIYWVITGAILVRQRVLDVIDDVWDDGVRCAGPFQGWRYLAPEDAPVDISDNQARVSDELPASLQRSLRALALLP